MFLSAPPGATILSTPQLQSQSAHVANSTTSQPPQQPDVSTSMADINSQVTCLECQLLDGPSPYFHIFANRVSGEPQTFISHRKR